jgi:two-component system sensor histidine kinase KdpD
VAWTADDRAALLATIEEGADRLGTLIANLLDMSRIQTGAVEPFVREVALDEVLPAAVRGADGATVLDVPDDLPLVRTDPVLLERAVANLVSNAVRYAPADRPPRIVARADAAGTALTIDVVDGGPGIPAEQRARAFEPFQQLGDQRAGGVGVGLGLAVAKGFVEALGGVISAAETPGGGLTMRVQLPVGASALRRAAVRQ